MLTFHGKNRQLTCSYGRQLKWIAREKHLPNRSRPYNKICPHRWKEKNKCTGIICWLRCCKLKDTTGQGLAEKLIEVIEKNFGLEEDSERHPSFNPGEKNLEAIFIPCCSHSLNLLLCDSASSNRECLTFFGTLQKLHTIFSSSVKRWDILK